MFLQARHSGYSESDQKCLNFEYIISVFTPVREVGYRGTIGIVCEGDEGGEAACACDPGHGAVTTGIVEAHDHGHARAMDKASGAE